MMTISYFSDVLVEVSIHGNKEQYEYKKKLPEDIISAKSSHKVTNHLI